MRKWLVTAVFAFVIVAMLAPPVLAQAPTPKVTITGLFDQVTSMTRNTSESNFSRDSDREWYARTRFRPDFVFEVGRTKAVLALEFDLTYGQVGATAGGPGKAQGATTLGTSRAHPGTTSDSGLNTDVTGVIEVKWMYTEFDLTGKDSVMPFIPVLTVARAGLQPFATTSQYKTSAYATGDYAGVSTKTMFAPNFLLNLAYVMVEDENGGDNRGGTGTTTNTSVITSGAAAGPLAAPTGKATRGNDFAIIVSPEVTPFKGLDIKPLYSYFHADGTTSASARRGSIDRHYATANTAATTNTANSAAIFGNAANVTNGSPAAHEDRHTIGVDARWRSGPFGLDPTIYYQWGNRQSLAYTSTTGGSTKMVDGTNSAWLFDVVGSFQAGPLLLEGRAVYTTGNNARDSLAKGIRYYEPLDTDTGYWSSWMAILALSDVDFGTGLNNGNMVNNVGYDRYGRAGFGVRATYSITPAFSVFGIVNPTWTAQKVDTDTGVSGGARTILNDQSFVKGDSSYIGTETNVGFWWKFAPNVSFDLIGAWLAAGHALDTTEILNGTMVKREARDAYALSSRVRFSF
jgi:hypothetical protein